MRRASMIGVAVAVASVASGCGHSESLGQTFETKHVARCLQQIGSVDSDSTRVDIALGGAPHALPRAELFVVPSVAVVLDFYRTPNDARRALAVAPAPPGDHIERNGNVIMWIKWESSADVLRQARRCLAR